MVFFNVGKNEFNCHKLFIYIKRQIMLVGEVRIIYVEEVIF